MQNGIWTEKSGQTKASQRLKIKQSTKKYKVATNKLLPQGPCTNRIRVGLSLFTYDIYHCKKTTIRLYRSLHYNILKDAKVGLYLITNDGN